MQKKKYDLTSELVDISSEPANILITDIPPFKKSNLPKEDKILLSISIDDDVRADFKGWCARHKLKMNEAFIKGFKLLKEKHGH